jgi:pimeloyl-ACP methyl ester carboxylesterase
MGRFVETNGIRLHVVEHTGDGGPLILMPGLTGNARFFDAVVADDLAPAVRVLAVGLRARGAQLRARSKPPSIGAPSTWTMPPTSCAVRFASSRSVKKRTAPAGVRR